MVNGESQQAMGIGTIIGELAYFAASNDNKLRTADVKCSSFDGCTLAIVTYTELDSLMESNPVLYGRLTKLLSVVSIQKLNQRYNTARTTYLQSNRPSVSMVGNNYSGGNRRPSLLVPNGNILHGGSVSPMLTGHRPSISQYINSSNGRSPPHNTSTLAHTHNNNNNKEENCTSPTQHIQIDTTNTDPNKHSPPTNKQLQHRPNSSISLNIASIPETETFIKQHLDTNLSIREDIIWDNTDHNHNNNNNNNNSNMNDNNNKTDHDNRLLSACDYTPSRLKIFSNGDKVKLYNLYHNNQRRYMQPNELKVFSRDLIEVILYNYACYLRTENNKRSKKKKYNDDVLHNMLNTEKNFLLPYYNNKQTDIQVINNMNKHIINNIVVGKGKDKQITEQMFVMNYEKLINELLTINKKNNESIGCNII